MRCRDVDISFGNVTPLWINHSLMLNRQSVASSGLLPGILTCFFSGCIGGFGLYLLSVCGTRVSGDRRASFFAISQMTFPKAGLFFDLAIAIKCFGVSIRYVREVCSEIPHLKNLCFFSAT